MTSKWPVVLLLTVACELPFAPTNNEPAVTQPRGGVTLENVQYARAGDRASCSRGPDHCVVGIVTNTEVDGDSHYLVVRFYSTNGSLVTQFMGPVPTNSYRNPFIVGTGKLNLAGWNGYYQLEYRVDGEPVACKGCDVRRTATDYIPLGDFEMAFKPWEVLYMEVGQSRRTELWTDDGLVTAVITWAALTADPEVISIQPQHDHGYIRLVAKETGERRVVVYIDAEYKGETARLTVLVYRPGTCPGGACS